jgi:hypothetical protein
MIFVAILGGTGFDAGFKRITRAFELTQKFSKKGILGAIITSGLGQNEDGVYERDFLANLAWGKGIPCIRGKDGDPVHRNSADDILQIINAIPKGYSSIIYFPTEGKIHAFRVWVYAKMQMPAGMHSSIKCVDDGHKLMFERRLREARSLIKMLLWLLKKIF